MVLRNSELFFFWHKYLYRFPVEFPDSFKACSKWNVSCVCPEGYLQLWVVQQVGRWWISKLVFLRHLQTGCLNGFSVSPFITNSATKKDYMSLLVIYNFKRRSFEGRVIWRLKKSERMGLECMAVVIWIN